jgi:hypothetical protein
MRERGSSLPLLAALLLLLPLIYVGAYAALLTPAPRLGMCRDGICRERRWPAYRLGGDTAAKVFWPLYNADRQLRQVYWEEELARESIP